MIRIRLSTILYVRDGFTGLVPAWGALRCTVDGRPFRPLVREGGAYLFLDLEEGPHTFVLTGLHYQPERLLLEQGCREAVVTMKPDDTYPFGRECPRLCVRLPAAGAELWVAAVNARTELKLAQSGAAAGDQGVQLFCRESARRMALPRDYLLADPAAPEVCRIGELGMNAPTLLSQPLEHGHKRGCGLYPAQCCQADAEGFVRTAFPEPGEAVLYRPGMPLMTLALQMGLNTLELSG
ncbi:MAG: hypothetical protein ACI4JC_00365 [Faecalibacterium sp.]